MTQKGFRIRIVANELIFSPFTPTIFPIFLLFISFIFPPDIYEYYINEKNLMFLNLKMLLFGILCTFFYFAGVYISTKLKPILLLTKEEINQKFISYLIFLSCFIIVIHIISLVFMSIEFLKVVGISIYQLAIQGTSQLIKDTLGKEVRLPFGLGGVTAFTPGILFYVIARYYYMKKLFQGYSSQMKKLQKLKILIYVSIFVFLIFNILTVNRPSITIFLLGWLCIYLHFYGTSFQKLTMTLIKVSFGIVAIFIIVSIVRWGGTYENLIYMVMERLIGYTIANFNRFAFIIDDRLSYVSNGVPAIFYIFPITKVPLTDIVFFDFLELSKASLGAVGELGLNSSYNMATLFAGIYQAIGYFALVYFIALGIFGGRLYNSFKNGTIAGVIFYPLFFSSVALWMIDVNVFFLSFPYTLYAFLFIIFTRSLWKISK